MDLNSQFQGIDKYALGDSLSKDSVYFNLCQKCSSCQSNVKEWMKHLVDRHPVPLKWMSEFADHLVGDKLLKPYTFATESRKKRKKHVIPRPLNSFMIFSRHLRRNVLLIFSDASNSEISKLLGKLWNNISVPIKTMYDIEAKKLASLHSKEFPEYKYQPKKKKKQYSNKRSVENFTPLSNNSFESCTVDFSGSISDATQTGNNFPRENNCALSNENFSKSKSNLFINHNLNYNQTVTEDTRKIGRKTPKQSLKIVSSQIMDDSEGAESSPSSFKNTMKNETFSTYSPFLKEYQKSLSDLTCSSFSNFVKSHNEFKPFSQIKEESTIHSYEINEKASNNNDNNYKYISLKNVNPPGNLTTPLTVVTDKIDESNCFQPSKISMHFIKMFPKSEITKHEMLVAKESSEINISQPAIHFNSIANYKSQISNFDLNYTSEIVGKSFSNFLSDQTAYNNRTKMDFIHKHDNLDPLIIEDMFENENFEEESLNFDKGDNDNSSPWSFKSPSLKISASSSNLSDNPYKETVFVTSPFHLSESESNPPPIQRLPAIGSWLKSNCSEFMI